MFCFFWLCYSPTVNSHLRSRPPCDSMTLFSADLPLIFKLALMYSFGEILLPAPRIMPEYFLKYGLRIQDYFNKINSYFLSADQATRKRFTFFKHQQLCFITLGFFIIPTNKKRGTFIIIPFAH